MTRVAKSATQTEVQAANHVCVALSVTRVSKSATQTEGDSACAGGEVGPGGGAGLGITHRGAELVGIGP